MVDAGRLTFFGATQDGEFTVGRRRAETAVGGGPYESSTAGQAMITYSHHSIHGRAACPYFGRNGTILSVVPLESKFQERPRLVFPRSVFCKVAFSRPLNRRRKRSNNQ